MSTASIRVLMIEDNPADARMIQELLKEACANPAGRAMACRYDVSWVDHLEAGLARLKAGEVDVVLLDLALPDSAGGETFRRVLDAADHIPVILLTGLQDEVLGFEAVRQGVQDYLVKGQADGNLLARVIHYAIERQRLLRQLEESMASVKTLSGLLPLCAHCRKVRNDAGYWGSVEAYIQTHTDARITHGICPECAIKWMAEFEGDWPSPSAS